MKCELLSASGAETYESCPLRYHARYELKKRSASSPEQEAGSIAHKVLERYYNPSLPATGFDEAFAAASKKEQCTDRKAFDEARQMAKDYIAANPRESLSVVGTEIGFKFFLESGAGAVGFIDRVDLEADNAIVLVDYKSGNFLRVTFTGRTELDGFFRDRPDTLLAECRATAAAVSENIWIEKVRAGTTPVHDVNAAASRPDAIGALVRSVDELKGDQGGLAVLAAELEKLLAKLPEDLGPDAASFRRLEGDRLADIIEDAKVLLVNRLLEGAAE